MNEILEKINNNLFPYAREDDIVFFENHWFIFKNNAWIPYTKE